MSSFRWCTIAETRCAYRLLRTYQNVSFKRWLVTYKQVRSAESAVSRKPATSFKIEGSKIRFQDSQYEDHFLGTRGFWPETTSPTPIGSKSKVVRQIEDTGPGDPTISESEKDFPSALKSTSTEKNSQDLFPAFKFPRKPGYKDLSYVSLERWESSGLMTQHPLPLSSFRENTGLRKILGRFASYMQSTFQSTNATFDIEKYSKSDHILLEVFSNDTLTFLESKGCRIEDVQAWFWILNSPSVDKAVRRYMVLSEDIREKNVGHIPLFVTLQILRSDTMSAESLSALIDELKSKWSSKSSINGRRAHPKINWDQTSAVLLIVRLIRFARKVAPEFLNDITILIPKLLAGSVAKNKSKSQSNSQLSRIYNRFLSLLSEPSSINPLRSTSMQQKAQLAVMRQMLDFNPPIPVNREGYRALVRVQSTHAKTEDERSWAAVKALTWPPWREDKLGIDEDLEYFGRDSRMMKVLRRMTEAGYSENEWEKRANIFAGWDTDKSPTIQTRMILPRKPMMWLKGLLSTPKENDPQPEPHVWAARITATRTVREAWASFSSYKKLSKTGQRHMTPYQAMFQKLFARIQHGSEVTPGDGKETYMDPLSPRDMVYVESEPLTVAQLYKDMLSNNIKPSGRFVSELMDNAESLETGLRYIKDSSYGEVKIDVLLHPEKYPWEFIRDTISCFPNHFFASYIGLLSRPDKSSNDHMFLPGSATEGPTYLPYKDRQITALGLAFVMLEGSGTKYLPAWNEFLSALPLQLRVIRLQSKYTKRTQYKAVTETKTILRYFRLIISKMNSLGLAPDFLTFRYVTNVARELMTFPNLGKSLAGFSSTTAKSLFLRISYGRDMKIWLPKPQDLPVQKVPDPDTLSALINILGISQDIPGIISLIKWMSEHSEKIVAVEEEFRCGNQAMQRTLTLARIFLEASWAGELVDGFRKARTATPDQIKEVQQLCVCFGWPSDHMVSEYLSTHKSWLRLVHWIVPNQLQWKRKSLT